MRNFQIDFGFILFLLRVDHRALFRIWKINTHLKVFQTCIYDQGHLCMQLRQTPACRYLLYYHQFCLGAFTLALGMAIFEFCPFIHSHCLLSTYLFCFFQQCSLLQVSLLFDFIFLSKELSCTRGGLSLSRSTSYYQHG